MTRAKGNVGKWIVLAGCFVWTWALVGCSSSKSVSSAATGGRTGTGGIASSGGVLAGGGGWSANISSRFGSGGSNLVVSGLGGTLGTGDAGGSGGAGTGGIVGSGTYGTGSIALESGGIGGATWLVNLADPWRHFPCRRTVTRLDASRRGSPRPGHRPTRRAPRARRGSSWGE